jgi:hypothetical protein
VGPWAAAMGIAMYVGLSVAIYNKNNCLGIRDKVYLLRLSLGGVFLSGATRISLNGCLGLLRASPAA